jgi:ribonuclease J
MIIKIHRGTHEIGGNCIEITANNGKVLWLDMGAPLSTVNPDTSYANYKVDALLISHPHQDHYGLMDQLGPETPIYIGQVSLELINATRLFLGKEPFRLNFVTIDPWKEIEILGTFRVYPYLMDHSSPEAFAFVVEVDGKRVFYSGDFRSTGRKKKLYFNLLRNPPKNIDLFFTEGTMVQRNHQKYPTEQAVYRALDEVIKNQVNTTFVVSSAQNIDRFISVVKACNSHRKKLIVDTYNAWILEVVSKKSPNLPTIYWNLIMVYSNESQLEKIRHPRYSEFLNQVKSKDIGNSIFENPSDYVYFLRCPNKNLIDKISSFGEISLVYSQWEGYLTEEHKNYSSDMINSLKTLPGVNFKPIHTSGHATLTAIKNLLKAVNPHKIVPMHTENPELLKTSLAKYGFSNVEIWEDGKEYNI